MDGSSHTEATTNTVAEPWDAQKPFLQDVFSQAYNMYYSGGLTPEYYPGQTVAAQSPYTQQAIQMQANRALNGSPLIDSASGTVNDIMNGSGIYGNQGLNVLNNYSDSSLYNNTGYNSMLGLADNGDIANDPYYSALANSANDAISGNQGLQALNTLSNAQNPYLDQLYDRAAGQALSKINGNFSTAGRYGSGAHEAAAADAMENLAADIYSGGYDQAVNAASAAANAYSQGIGQQTDAYAQALNQLNNNISTRLGAYQNASNAYNQDISNILSAAADSGQLYNQGISTILSGTDKAVDLGNQAYTDAAALSEAGGVLDDYNQMLINADIDRYNYNVNNALNALSNYNQLIQGSYGGTSTSTAKQGEGTGPSRLGSVIGGTAAGLGMLDMLGGIDAIKGLIG